MERRQGKALRLFKKEVFQTQDFSEQIAALDKDTPELIVEVTATHYPLFRRLRHGLVLGQLSEDLPKGYVGPGLEFLYKVLSNKVCFLCLRVGGFSQEELASIETDHDL